MNWLLKVVEGPVKGAEIALVEGMRLKVGSSDKCDIVLADSTVPAEAFELDVASEAVTLVQSDGSAAELVPFEVKTIGTCSFAVGPVDGNWKSLVKAVEKKVAQKAQEVQKVEATPETATDEEPTKAPEKKRRGWLGWLIALIVIALIAAGVWALFHYRPACTEEYLVKTESYVEKAKEFGGECVEKSRPYIAESKDLAKRGWTLVKDYWTLAIAKIKGEEVESAVVEVPPVDPVVAMRELAAAYELKLSETDGGFTLSGNLQRRTERKAIRALALAIDPNVKFDITDDETLRDASNELLFALTGGTLKAIAATNRVVTIVGYAETSQELMDDVMALNADVKGIEKLDTSKVRLGLKAQETPIVPSPAEFVVDKAAPDMPMPEPPKKQAQVKRSYPVAGILMKPYPCVVMKNGLRLLEGSELGSAHIERIEANKIVLKEGAATFEWEP